MIVICCLILVGFLFRTRSTTSIGGGSRNNKTINERRTTAKRNLKRKELRRDISACIIKQWNGIFRNFVVVLGGF